MLTTMNRQESVRLTMGWSFTDETSGTPILSHLFAEMVKRAIPVVQAYHGDLFHDAEWLRANVKGECDFWFMVRSNGTNIGESAVTMEHISSSESRVLYHVSLTHGRLDAWTVTFTEVVRVEPGPSYLLQLWQGDEAGWATVGMDDSLLTLTMAGREYAPTPYRIVNANAVHDDSPPPQV